MKNWLSNLSDQTLLQIALGLLIFPPIALLPNPYNFPAFIFLLLALLLYIHFSDSQINSHLPFPAQD